MGTTRNKCRIYAYLNDNAPLIKPHVANGANIELLF